VTVHRLIHAPRPNVFEAFLAAEPLRKWFGPDGFDTVTHEIDARREGLWRFTMHGPDGTKYPNWVRYVEFVPPERLVWDQGRDLGGEPWHRTTVTLEEADGATHVTLHMQFPDAAARRRAVEERGAVEGGKQTLARLAQYVEARA
jgi:uncharacterized protein YndB with AHSA1/START domain